MFETGNHIVEICILFSFKRCIFIKLSVFKELPPFCRKDLASEKEKKCKSSSATLHLFHQFGDAGFSTVTPDIFLETCKSMPKSTEYYKTHKHCTPINMCTTRVSQNCVPILKITRINENWNKMLFERRCYLEMLYDSPMKWARCPSIEAMLSR